MEKELRRLLSVLEIESLYTAFVCEYGSDFNFPGESHELWEIGVVLQGCAGITSGAEIYECNIGEMIIHPPGVFHTAWAMHNAGVRILTATFTAHGGTRYIPAGKFVLTPQEMSLAALLGERIIEILGAQSPGQVSMRPSQEQILKGYLELLCLSLHLRRAEMASPQREEKATLFAEIVGYMQAHVDDALSVEDICIACGIGRTVLKELFHRYTGTGVIQYYHHLRVRRIIELINEGEHMGAIASRMNFSSQSYFTDFFRRQTGVAPSAYFERA